MYFHLSNFVQISVIAACTIYKVWSQSCDGSYRQCLFASVTPMEIEYKIISADNGPDRIDVSYLKRALWKFIKSEDDSPLISYDKKYVTIKFGTEQKNKDNNNVKGYGTLNGFSFIRNREEYDKEFKENDSSLRDRDWRKIHLNGNSTWKPIPNDKEMEEMVVNAKNQLEIYETRRRVINKVEEELKGLKSDQDTIKKKGIELKEILKTKEKELEKMKKDILNNGKRHETLLKEKTNKGHECDKVEERIAETTKEVQKEDKEIVEQKGRDKEKEEKRQKKKEEREEKKEEEKRRREEIKRKAETQAKQREETRKTKRGARRTKREKNKRTKTQTGRAQNSFQQKLGKVLRTKFGKKTNIHQAYHGFFGKDLTSRKGLVYEIHQLIAHFIRMIVGMSRVGLDH